MAGTTEPSAYADLVAALVAVRSDPATARFDAELARAEAAGSLDGATARTLRWWQRESVRGLAEHLTVVLPAVLATLESADAAAHAAVEDSADSWTAATSTAVAPATSALDPSDLLGPPLHGPDGPVLSAAPALRDVSAPHETARPHDGPAGTSPPAAPRVPEARGSALGAPRHRLLVAGLTVLGDSSGPDSPGRIPMS